MEDKKNLHTYMCHWIRRAWWLKEKLLYPLRHEREANTEWGLALTVAASHTETEKSIPAKAWKLTISWPPKLTIITTRFPCLNHLIEIIIMGIFMSLLPVHEIWPTRNNGYPDYIVTNMHCYTCVLYAKFLQPIILQYKLFSTKRMYLI